MMGLIQNQTALEGQFFSARPFKAGVVYGEQQTHAP